ncbi:amidophosphoribosyltransferase [Physcia stellaris]|nr:amidophosphoribosyltransferase [Physcia stellaris]
MVLLELLWLSSWLLSPLATAHNIRSLSPRANTTIPAPIVFPPSQEFQGNDGPWSTFTLRLGTPEQDVNVMVSTASYQTWAVIPQGCTSEDPPDCKDLRGGEFNYNESSTWVQNNVTEDGLFALNLEINLGYGPDGNGLFGYDTVGLSWMGSGGPSLDQQIVAGIATKNFYLGVFGLNPRPTNFTNYNHPVSSFMSNLKEANLIPSLSWSYTAGNQYRLDKVLGSLTLGGYDSSRYVPNDVIFDFDEVDARDLSVDISSIIYTEDGKNTTLMSTPLSAYLDSTIPWIYLPRSVCRKFESAFGLEFDNQTQSYLVNDTLHKKLQSSNASVTFTLRNPSHTGEVDITLPYAAFDLVAQYPLSTNGSLNYFPLVPATNDSQYTLGRTFFQEAYISADYERRTFTVSQCDWSPSSQKQNIHPISSPSTSTTSPTPSPPSTPSKPSPGAIAGSAIGGLALLALLATGAYFLSTKILLPRRAHNKQTKKAELDNDGERRPELDGKDGAQEIDGEAKGFYGAEVEGKRLPGHELEGVGSPGAELDAGFGRATELPAREAPAAELP